jgi:hypothetical protein
VRPSPFRSQLQLGHLVGLPLCHQAVYACFTDCFQLGSGLLTAEVSATLASA